MASLTEPRLMVMGRCMQNILAPALDREMAGKKGHGGGPHHILRDAVGTAVERSRILATAATIPFKRTRNTADGVKFKTANARYDSGDNTPFTNCSKLKSPDPNPLKK